MFLPPTTADCSWLDAAVAPMTMKEKTPNFRMCEPFFRCSNIPFATRFAGGLCLTNLHVTTGSATER